MQRLRVLSRSRSIPKPNSAAKAAYHHGDLKRALVNAAAEILEADGVAALSLRGVARRVGVSQTAPYHHFKDKNALLVAVAAEGYRRFRDEMQAFIRSASEDAQGRLNASGVGYVKFATDNPALFTLMFGSAIEAPEQFPELAEASAASYETLERSISAKLAASGGDTSAAPLLALSAWSQVHGLAKLIVDGRLDIETFGAKSPAELTEMMFAALATRTDS